MRWMEEDQKTVRGTVFPTTQLATGLREGEIAELVKDQEVETAKQVCRPPLSVSTGFGIKLVHQVHDIED